MKFKFEKMWRWGKSAELMEKERMKEEDGRRGMGGVGRSEC